MLPKVNNTRAAEMPLELKGENNVDNYESALRD